MLLWLDCSFSFKKTMCHFEEPCHSKVLEPFPAYTSCHSKCWNRNYCTIHYYPNTVGVIESRLAVMFACILSTTALPLVYSIMEEMDADVIINEWVCSLWTSILKADITLANARVCRRKMIELFSHVVRMPKHQAGKRVLVQILYLSTLLTRPYEFWPSQ